MAWVRRVFVGLVAFVVVDQTLAALADWEFADEAFYAEVLKRADLRPMTDDEAPARGWEWRFQSCEIHRSTFGYPVRTCFGRVGDLEVNELQVGGWVNMYIWDAKPVISFRLQDHFSGIYAHPIMQVYYDKTVKKIYPR